MAKTTLALSLFWRTFVLLALLLAGGIFAWVLALQKFESEPRVVLVAQQIAALVNLSREGLRNSDPINRVSLVKAMSASEVIRLLPREPGDQWEPFEQDSLTRQIGRELRSRLGSDAMAARSVNGVPGMWVGFTIENDAWWLKAEAARIHPLRSGTWLVWAGIALLATVAGSVVMARLINRPLRDLSQAAHQIRAGRFDVHLDETSVTTEIRDLNLGFNRMARELAKVDHDRTVMLAGISHDLRAPLTRLRLEAELGAIDPAMRANMVGDIVQLDAIIGKFMEYARPGVSTLQPVGLAALVEQAAAVFAGSDEIHIDAALPSGLQVLADEVELGRVFGNLFENARRYGRSADTGVAVVQVRADLSGPQVVCTVRDQGAGVAPDQLAELTKPFYRGDAARSSPAGAGLGLAIVERAMQRMGGAVVFSNAEDGGLQARLQLKHSG
jgi:two-component system osmolarity sensor histidine kinase EnvZ